MPFWTVGTRVLSLDMPIVMGIVNLSPDSFYGLSRVESHQDFLFKVERMIHDGASVIDLGAASSRPHASLISEEDEWALLESYIREFRFNFPDTLLSIDSFRSSIAKKALDLGANIINDIKAGSYDDKMFDIIAEYNAGYIMMHMREMPSSMNHEHNLIYGNISSDIIHYFSHRLHEAKIKNVLHCAIDPGFGFSKSVDQNYVLLRELNAFQILDKPIVVGISRKSMIYKILECEPEQALSGSLAATMLALIGGANIIRTHDVKSCHDIIKIFNKYNAN